MADKTLNNVLEHLIDPPPGMLGIQRVAKVLSVVLERAWLIKAQVDANEGQTKPEFLDRIPELREFCDSIANQSDGSGPWVEKDNAQRQFMTDHPIYSALFELSKSTKPLSEGRLQLMAHCLVAAHIGLPSTDGRTEMPKANLQSAFRELRRLDSRLLDSVLFELPSRQNSYRSLSKIEQSKISGFGRKELQQLGHIRRLIGLSLGAEKPLESSERNKGDGGTVSHADGLASSKEVSPGQLGEIAGETFSLVEASLANPTNEEFGKLEGLAPNDVIARVRQSVPSGRSNPRRGGSQQQAVHNARHIKNQMRRSAQSLTGRWDRLTEFDVVSSISMLSWQGAGRNLGTIAAGLVLLSGRPLDTVLNTRLVDNESQVPRTVSEDSMVICYENAFIQAFVPVPERSRPLRAEWYANLVPAENQLRLPIVRLLWDLLVDYLGESESKWHGHLFPRSDRDDIEKSAKSTIAEVLGEDGARLTVPRLQRCVYNEIADVLGDTAEAVFITGNQPSSGTHTGTHYYCVSEADLQDRYLKALRNMVPEELQESLAPVRHSFSREHFVGSPLCPTFKWLAESVTAIRSRLMEAKDKPLNADHLIELHNAYTLYVVMFLAMATGYRNVHAPLSRSTDYDPMSEMLVVADKTGDAFSHARLVPLPEVLSRQLDLYSQHRDRVADRLWAILGIEEPKHFLFFLSESSSARASPKLIRIVEVTGKELKRHLRGVWELPLNINRHFMRSELRRRNVSAELVDAWMGHWLDGQEPMGRFSSLSPIDFSANLEPVVSEILAEMGWSPEEGLS